MCAQASEREEYKYTDIHFHRFRAPLSICAHVYTYAQMRVGAGAPLEVAVQRREGLGRRVEQARHRVVPGEYW